MDLKEAENRATMMRFWEAAEARDIDALASLTHLDLVMAVAAVGGALLRPR